jgi:Zn-dependent membrane protease YugP
VLNAAAWTYVAATLQTLLTLLYYLLHFTGGSNRD